MGKLELVTPILKGLNSELCQSDRCVATSTGFPDDSTTLFINLVAEGELNWAKPLLRLMFEERGYILIDEAVKKQEREVNNRKNVKRNDLA